MAEVKAKANACAQRLGQSGTAELKISVGKEGGVTDVRVGGKVANTPLGACVDKVVRAATFRPNAGLRFDYRIDAH
jgi:TonB family protein